MVTAAPVSVSRVSEALCLRASPIRDRRDSFVGNGAEADLKIQLRIPVEPSCMGGTGLYRIV
jgi:hypothetical protein